MFPPVLQFISVLSYVSCGYSCCVLLSFQHFPTIAVWSDASLLYPSSHLTTQPPNSTVNGLCAALNVEKSGNQLQQLRLSGHGLWLDWTRFLQTEHFVPYCGLSFFSLALLLARSDSASHSAMSSCVSGQNPPPWNMISGQLRHF